MREHSFAVTPEQARFVADAVQAQAKATEVLTLVVRALAAGHVPDGSALADVNIEHATLTFRVPEGTPDAG